MSGEFDAQVAALKDVRAALVDAQAAYDMEFRRHMLGVEKRLKEARDAAATIEADLRASIVRYWEQTPDAGKTFDHGLGLKVSEKVDYDARDALTWCQKNATVFVINEPRLDTKGFEAFARERVGTDLLQPPATIVTKVTATIPKEL